MADLLDMIKESGNFIIEKSNNFKPDIGIILGTGLGGLANEIDKEFIIDYKDIPHFPLSTVETHSGKLILGKMSGKKIIAMQGRFHRYEGYTMQQITFPVRVMKYLGIKYLLISNAAGGMNKNFKAGELAIIEDIINFMGDNPLIGKNYDELGPRWPDMIEPISKELIKLAEESAKELNIKINKGVYIGVTGPNLETRAEYRMFRNFADMVGMSTVPEIIVGVHSGLKILGISVITDECDPDHLEPADISKIIKNAQEAEPKLTAIMKKVIEKIKI